MIKFVRNLALAVVAAVGLAGGAQAAPIHLVDNIYGGTLAGANTLGPMDLASGAFAFSGFAGAASGSLTADFFSSSSAQSAVGSLQIQILAGNLATFTVNTLTFGGNPLTLTPITGGWSATITGLLPSQLVFAFSNANAGDQLQITVAAVPLPAGGLLLIGGLGALALVRRRKAAAA